MGRRVETTTSDDDLVAACLHGEQAAWDVLVDRYAALIYSIPIRYGPASAMRRAQIDLRHEAAHPYYWAPFVVIGRP